MDIVLFTVCVIHAAAALGGVVLSIPILARTRRVSLIVLRSLRLVFGLMWTYTGLLYALYFINVIAFPLPGWHTWIMLFGSVCGSFYVLFAGLHLRGRDG